MYETVAQSFAFDGLRRHFNPEAAKGQRAVFQFNIGGAGEWHVIVNDGNFEVKDGVDPSPDVILGMNEQNYLDLVNNKLSIQQAYITGLLQVSGDLPTALKLPAFFPAPKGGY